jgi:hypothetical protein
MKKALYFFSILPLINNIVFVLALLRSAILVDITWFLTLLPVLILWFLIWLGFLIYMKLKKKISQGAIVTSVVMCASSILSWYLLLNDHTYGMTYH